MVMRQGGKYKTTMNVKNTNLYSIVDVVKAPLGTREKGNNYYFILF